MLGVPDNGSIPLDEEPCVRTRVLVVDDYPDIARSCAFLLNSAGFVVLTASNGHDALQLAKEFHPGVALLDLALPDLDGFEVARRLRADLTLPTMTLIAVTAYGSEEHRSRAKAAGFDYFLVKPMRYPELLALIGCPSQAAENAT